MFQQNNRGMKIKITKFNSDFLVEYSVNRFGEFIIDRITIDSLDGLNRIDASRLSKSRYAFFFDASISEIEAHYDEYCADMREEEELSRLSPFNHF